jgi:excisionase family DNA binding protein
MQDDRLTYKIAEAARLLGVGRNQAYAAAQCGQLPSIRIGTRVLVPKNALDRMLRDGNAPPNPIKR